MSAFSSGRSRARPVADAPVLDGAEVAKAWLVELVERAPLDRAARLPGPRFAEDAPALCAAIAEALASDAVFEELEPGGPLAQLAGGSAQLAAASSAPEAVAALEALRAVVWAAITAALDRPRPAQVGELADRLAAVVATLTAAVLEAPHAPGPARPGDRSGPLAAVLRDAREGGSGAEAGPVAGEPPPAGAQGEDEPGVGHSAHAPEAEDEDGLSARWARPPTRPRAVRGPRAWPAEEPGDRPEHRTAAPERSAWVTDHVPAPEPPAAPRGPEGEDPWAVPVAAGHDAPAPGDGADVALLREPVSGAETLAQIEATLREAASAPDPLAEAAERLRALARTTDLDLPEEAPAVRPAPEFEDASSLRAARLLPWTAAIERRLVRHQADGLPFAVLCVELADLDRLVAADRDRDVLAALEAAEAAILTQLRPADGLVRERAGRYWLTTPDTDAAEARALGLRIAASIAELPPHRGAPLEVAVGVTACPADAADAAALEALAEEGLFAARAAGLRVSGPPR
jgi:hypothetical protein